MLILYSYSGAGARQLQLQRSATATAGVQERVTTTAGAHSYTAGAQLETIRQKITTAVLKSAPPHRDARRFRNDHGARIALYNPKTIYI